MVIQHNVSAMYTNNQLGVTTKNQTKSTEKLSSGYRINRAADDAAGLSISEKMRFQIRGLNRASLNAEEGISLIQTAEGALNEVHADLQRMRELYVQNCNDTNTPADREAIFAETKQLYENIVEITNNTTFNGRHILGGEMDKVRNNNEPFLLQVGSLSGQTIELNIPCCSPEPLDHTIYAFSDLFETNADFSGTVLGGYGIGALIKESYLDISHKAYLNPHGNDIATHYSMPATPNDSIAFQVYDKSIEAVSNLRSKLGAIQNRLEHTVANLDNVAENTQSSESKLRDTDMAEEMVNYSKENILAQAGQAMLTQANAQTEGILKLLQ
ncbi:MAG: flagellin [Lachnospiraceae bacterium]|nr:flagellin [Lachnospiraceae bacterium]